MGAITSLFARKIVRAADDTVDRAALLASIGLDPHGEPEVGQMVSDVVYYDLLERIAAMTGGAVELPLKTGASMRCDDYGAFGLAWKAAPTLRDSFARSERYARLLTSVAEYELRLDGNTALFMLNRPGVRRLGMRMSNEASLASVLSIIREVSHAGYCPLEVYFNHVPPRYTSAHEAYFGCPVVFDAGMDAILISADALTRPNRLGDDGLSRFLLRHLDEELERLANAPSLEQMIRNAVAQSLSGGVPKMPEIARRMGLSERTLHRRLAEEGLSFQKIAGDARQELAEGLLNQSDYSLAEIAFLTGFSEQSAFTRAFKRWVNQTPAAYRGARRSA